MKMKLTALAIAVGLFFAIPVAVYATDYQGEYDLTVKLTVVSNEYADAQVVSFETESDPMEVMSLWANLLKGKGGNTIGNFTVYVDVWQEATGYDSRSESAIILYSSTGPGDPVDFTFEFHEKVPGETTVRVHIMHIYTATVVYDYTWTVNIP